MRRRIIPLDKPPGQAIPPPQEPPLAPELPKPEPAKAPEPAKQIKRIADDTEYGIDLDFGLLDRVRGDRGTILPLFRSPEDAPIMTAFQTSLHSDPDIGNEIQGAKESLAEHASNVAQTIVKKRSGRFFKRLFGVGE